MGSSAGFLWSELVLWLGFCFRGGGSAGVGHGGLFGSPPAPMVFSAPTRSLGAAKQTRTFHVAELAGGPWRLEGVCSPLRCMPGAHSTGRCTGWAPVRCGQALNRRTCRPERTAVHAIACNETGQSGILGALRRRQHFRLAKLRRTDLLKLRAYAEAKFGLQTGGFKQFGTVRLAALHPAHNDEFRGVDMTHEAVNSFGRTEAFRGVLAMSNHERDLARMFVFRWNTLSFALCRLHTGRQLLQSVNPRIEARALRPNFLQTCLFRYHRPVDKLVVFSQNT